MGAICAEQWVPWDPDTMGPDRGRPPNIEATAVKLRAVVVWVVFVLAGCAGGALPRATRSMPPSNQPPASTLEPAPVFDGTIPVTADRDLSVQCWGSGTPTILLEAGGTSSDLSNWPTLFVTALAADNTVCLYSRAGGPGSTPVDGLLTRQQIVHDADTMLAALEDKHGVTGPYVLVGGRSGDPWHWPRPSSTRNQLPAWSS